MTEREWEQRLLGAIDESSPELLALAARLIRTPSENPDGDCTAVAELIVTHLSAGGIAPDTFDPGQGRVSVLAHLGEKRPDDRHLVFAGHSDVVPIGDSARWSFPPFAGDIVDGYLRGRGASDMKAGLAGLIHVFMLLRSLKVPLAGKLSFVAVPDEETGGQGGADWLLDQGVLAGADGGVIAEPAERTHPTIGQKGSNWFRLTLRGQPGHGSLQPIHGRSANLLAARAILALQQLWAMVPHPPEELRQLIQESKVAVEEREGYGPGIGAVFDHVTINVGTVTGGTSTNVVADTCTVDIDTRIPIGLTQHEVLARARELLAAENIEATIEPLGMLSEPNWTAPTDPIVVTLVGALRDLTDPGASGVLQWASSDARTFRRHGIPVLQYGPAELSSIHGYDERVPVESVILAAKVYAVTAIRYLGLRE
ncbi:MAG: succinyl-diaminopimelate desuccinylase [Candidatus Lumbricidophila eiseniae]|uniref:Succinyl-diaminopimelate desuccinylase n=1 Tax=Candidatus Lumbricidiphila eiseniae TaxID=1969409 RepID=A0A2A6FTI5_9MICO|nr:MAG: succinyl-diaminopimelate desuccinylase [Candidatus Lumbricidophila eiseniae]